MTLSWLCWHHIWIRPEKPLAVEVDHVVGVFGDPDFGFPGDVRDEGLHGAAVLEGGDEHEARFAAGEQVFEFLAALAVHRAGAGAVVHFACFGWCGPMNESPLKCTRWSGASAIQTSVSHEISAANLRKVVRLRKAVT